MHLKIYNEIIHLLLYLALFKIVSYMIRLFDHLIYGCSYIDDNYYQCGRRLHIKHYIHFNHSFEAIYELHGNNTIIAL